MGEERENEGRPPPISLNALRVHEKHSNIAKTLPVLHHCGVLDASPGR